MTKAKAKETKETSKTPFLAKLKSKCTNCTASSIAVYFAAVKRLHRLISDEEVPATGAWLKKPELMKRYEALPLSKRRHLSLAGVKAAQSYKQDESKWSVKMFRDQSVYMTERGKNKRSPDEKKKWPKHGFKAIKQAATEQRKRIRHLLKEEPQLKNLYAYQIWLLLKLYSTIPFRNTFATLNLKDKTKNYVRVPKKGSIVFEMKKFKNSKQLGEREVKLSRGATTALRKFLRYREGLVDHDWLFSGKSGGKLSRAALGKMLFRVTKQLLGRAFGSRLIRVLFATDNQEEIKKVDEMSNKLLHTPAQTRQYVRKS